MSKKRDLPPVGRKDRERFWDKVEKSSDGECWEWIGATVNTGYGSFGIGGYKTFLAHRVSFYIEHGFSPDNCNHTCDNRLCVNPRHLYSGTQSDNVQDMLKRNKTLRKNLCIATAKRHGKISENDVPKIRSAYASGDHSYDDIAAMFQVSKTTIYCIVIRKTWKHVE